MSHVTNVWTKTTDLVVASGSGSRLTTVDGVEYLDFTAGGGTASLGHCHPSVSAAVADQAGRLMQTNVNAVTNDLVPATAEAIANISPATISKVYLGESAVATTEAAVKFVKQVTGRPNILVFSGSFFGSTHMAMAMNTAKAVFRAGHAPLPSGVFVAPFPDILANDQSQTIRQAVAAFDRVLATQTTPEELAAVFLEPVLSEGGLVPAPREFVEQIYDRCQNLNILFVANEINTGFGRTGAWFSVDRFGIAPDVLMMSKGLTSGVPFGALGYRADLDEFWPKGSHGGAYDANPIGCAAALATIEHMSEPGFFNRVTERGNQLKDGLNRMKEEFPAIRQVRGPGLMIGVSLEDASLVPAVIDHCVREGNLLLMSCGATGSVIRWVPPLTVSADEISESLAVFELALRATLP